MLFLYLALGAIVVTFLLGLRLELLKERNRQRKKIIIRKWLALALWLTAVVLLGQRGVRLPPILIIAGLLFIYFITWYALRLHDRKHPPANIDKMKRANARN